MKEKLFITGINGLLGTNLINELLDKDFKIKGLVRNKKKYHGKINKNLELIQGTLFDDFTELLKGVDVVIHIAAITSQNLLDYYDYWQINYNASVQLFHAAINCKVKKFIYVSTANTLGFGTINNPGNESLSIERPFNRSYYAKSKLSTENHILNHTNKIDTIIVNPTFMIGPFDSKPSSGKILLMSWKKKFVFYPSGGKNFVHVRDVVEGIISSIKNGKNGEKYILSNENLSFFSFFKKVNTLTNQTPIMISIPKILMLTLGYLGDMLRILNIKTNLSSVNMKILNLHNYYSNKKSIEQLGVIYHSVDSAILDAIEYFSKTKKMK